MEQHVDVILKETVTEHVVVDEHLADRVRKLVDLALDEAEEMLSFGMPDQKLQLIRTLLSASTRNIGKDFTNTEQEAKVAINRLFDQMREVDVVDAPTVTAIAPRVDDPD
jgi:hypothetical protein